ncbi:MAG: hypothetical protein NHB14_19735 [Desulfosporosinus sp.]|nr:hypothetical protein [Desulfosporosinus sp.]
MLLHNKTLGQQMAQQRKKRQLSQAQLAEESIMRLDSPSIGNELILSMDRQKNIK